MYITINPSAHQASLSSDSALEIADTTIGRSRLQPASECSFEHDINERQLNVLSQVPWLTDSAVKHLQQLSQLATLSLADNGNIRWAAGRCLSTNIAQRAHTELLL